MCESIITGMTTARVVPEAFAELVSAVEPAEPVGDVGVGDTLVLDDLEITLLKVDWKGIATPCRAG